jgi:hypothetical protein
MLTMSQGANKRKRDEDDDGQDYASTWPKTNVDLQEQRIIRAWKPQQNPKTTAPGEYPSHHGNWKDPKGDPFWRFAGMSFPESHGLRDTQIERWLASQPKWKNKIDGTGCKGTKFLGKGSFGMVGLWENTTPQIVAGQSVMKVAVKQSSASGLSDLQAEAQHLKVLEQTGSRHIVRAYGNISIEKGQGTIGGDD